MKVVPFNMPPCAGTAFDITIRQLRESHQPGNGAVRVINFVPDKNNAFAHLDLTYYLGGRVLSRYEAFLSLVEFNTKQILTPYYRFISAAFYGQSVEDFGCGDVGPFFMLNHNPLFHHLNPNWRTRCREMSLLEVVLLYEDTGAVGAR